MKVEIKILLVWLLCLLILSLLLLFPHQQLGWITIVNVGVQLLLSLISLWIALKTDNSHKYVYLNFFFLFGCVPPLFMIHHMLRPSIGLVYYYICVNKFGFSLAWIVPILYVLGDDLFRQWRTAKKYVISFSCALVITVGLYYPYLSDPGQLYRGHELMQLQQLKSAQETLMTQLNRAPTEEELAQAFQSASTTSGEDVARSSVIVHNLRPYLAPGGAASIFWRPFLVLSIYVHAITSIFIALFLWFVYSNDKPHGDYVDKIMILFFALGVIDIVSNYGFNNSVSTEIIQAIFSIGQYMTVLVLLVMVYAFSLKLRFVYSAAGQYYEKVLFESPERITRWRDELDNLILKLFFKGDNADHRIGQLGDPTLHKQ